VVVAKPPAPEVAGLVRARAAKLTKPVVFALLGAGGTDLTSAVGEVLHRLGATGPDPWPAWHPAPRPEPQGGGRGGGRGGALRGLFSGGTLRDEAVLIAGPGHPMVDFGADELTRGRPHPMIDHTLRLERLAAEAADPSVAVILLDVVLGHGADADPAAALAPAIEAACRRVACVVSLTGTSGDPQGLHRQAETLRDAGATVFLSNAEAARYAVRLSKSPS
jgi:FdrA protein